MNYNPLQNLEIKDLIYIHNTAEIGSELWRNSGYMLSAKQMSIENQLKQFLDLTQKK